MNTSIFNRYIQTTHHQFRNFFHRLVGGSFQALIVASVVIGTVLFSQTTFALVTDGMNATDLLGQYDETSYTSPVPLYTKTAQNNGPNRFGFSGPYATVMDTTNHRLFVADNGNNRILIYNMTAGNVLTDKVPDNILGQSNYYTSTSGTTSSTLNGPRGMAYDGVSNRLFVADKSNNRVLVFDVTPATITDGEAAIHVLGQANFTSNATATTSTGMSGPIGLAYDATAFRLFVSDNGNNRVITFSVTAGMTDGEAASNVLGQATFTTNTAATSSTGMNSPQGIAYDSAGSRLFVSQLTSNRVTVYSTAAIVNGQAATKVLGQTLFTTSTAATTAAGMNMPIDVAYDSTNSRLFVAEYNNRRVTVFSVAAIVNGQAATKVLGQTALTVNVGAISQSGMNFISGVMYDSTNSRVYVSEVNNNRVTIFDVTPATIANGENATDVMGQYDQTSFSNPVGVYTKGSANDGPNIFGFSSGNFFAVDTVNHRLFIEDTSNSRILVYNLNGSNALSDKIPDNVIGQPNFYTNSTGTTSSKLSTPQGIAFDSVHNRLFAADYGNSRVLVFDTSTISDGMSASHVLGQALFTTSASAVTASGMSFPRSVTYDSTNDRLFVADTSNNRVTVYDVAPGVISDGEAATKVLGQATFTTNALATTQAGMKAPRAVEYDTSNNRLFVGDALNERVTIYDATPGTLTNGENASNVLGKANFTTSGVNATQSGLGVICSLAYDTSGNRLFVLDLNNNRVMLFDVTPGVLADGENASHVLGQSNFTSSTAAASQSGLTVAGMGEGIGYNSSNGLLYVSSSNSNSVHIFDVSNSTTVTNVTSSTTNGSYTTGATVSIQITFSAAVTVTGTPQLTLETGTTDEIATYTSGSGTSTLTFTYTVAAGDTSADLDYHDTAALALNGGAINATSGGAAATLTLASPGAAGSLGANKAIVIDTTADAAPGTPDLLTADDSAGTSNTDNITNVAAGRYVVSCVTGDTVGLYNGATLLGTGACAASTVTIASSSLADGTYSLTAIQTDLAGNVSAASSALSVTIDTVAPTTPTITAPAAASYWDSTTTVTGACETGSTVYLANANITGSPVSLTCAGGAYSQAVTWNGGTSGSQTITVHAGDTAGNTTGNVTVAVNIDQIAPVIVFTNNVESGPVASDTVLMTVTETNPDTATYTYAFSADSTCNAADFTGGEPTYTSGTGISFTTEANNGKYLCARATDLASHTTYLSSTNPFNLDVTAPVITFTDDVDSIYNTSAVGVETVAATVSDSNPDTSTYMYGFVPTSTCDATQNASLTSSFTAGGSFSFTDSSTANNGKYVCIKAVDLLGNTSYLSSAHGIYVSSTPPDVPDITSPVNGTITSNTTPTFAGDVDEPDVVLNGTETIRVYLDTNSNGSYDAGVDTSLCTTTVTDNGMPPPLEPNIAWGGCVTGTPLADGTYTVKAATTDSFAVVSTSTSSALTIDTTAPTITLTDDVSVTPAQSDSVTVTVSDANPSIATYLYTYSSDNVCNAADFAGGESTYVTGTGIPHADETHNGKWFCAKASDAAGNTSYVVSASPFVVDITPPATPIITAPANGSTTNDNTPDITGTAEANSIIAVTEGGGTLCTTTATAGGSYTCTSSALVDGSHTIGVTATDGAGNVSTAATATFTVDTTPDAAPGIPDLQAASDSGTLSIDDITNDNTPTFDISCVTGSTVHLYAGATDVGNSVCSGGTVSITASPSMSDAVYSMTATQIDPAGNVSAASGALSVTIDTTNSGAPGTPDMTAATDTGTSSTDDTTSNNTPNYTVSCASGDTVAIYNGATSLGTGTCAAGTVTISASSLADGTYSITATQTDAAGNTSASSAGLSVTILTVAPATPGTPDLITADDSGTSSSDDITNVATPHFTVSCTTGNSVDIYGGATLIGSGSCVAGTVTVLSSSLADGVYSITAMQTNIVGLTSVASPALSVTIDTTADAAPSAPDMTAATDTGASNTDNITNNSTPSFTVSCVTGSTVTLKEGTTVHATGTCAGGTITLTSDALSDGTYNFFAYQTDVAGNDSADSSPLLVVVTDTVSDVAPSTIDLQTASDTGISSADNITSVTTPTLDILTCVTGDTVILYAGATNVGTGACVGGTVSIVSSLLADGTYIFTSTQTDPAGNVSVASSSLSVTIDTSADVATTAPDLNAASDSGISATDNITFDTTPTLDITTCVTGDTVTLYAGATSVGTGTCAGGTTSITSSALTDGTYSFTTTQTDPAGNTSVASPALSVTIDTVAPVAPDSTLLTPVSASATTATPTSVIGSAGTVEALSTATLLEGATTACTTTAAADGSFTCSLTQTSGAHTYTLTSTDVAGNTSLASSTYSLTYTPPAAATSGGGGGGSLPKTPAAAPQAAKPTTTPAPKICSPYFSTNLKRGDTGSEVLKMQNFLESQGFITDGKGNFGVKTDIAVHKFQAQYFDEIITAVGLPDTTGLWYASTQSTANRIYCGKDVVAGHFTSAAPQQAKVTTTKPTPDAPKACLDTFTVNLKIGSTNTTEIKKMQAFLISQGFDVGASGVFDKTTDQAVRDFQALYYDDILAKSGDTKPTGLFYQYTRAVANKIICGQQQSASPQSATVTPTLPTAAKAPKSCPDTFLINLHVGNDGLHQKEVKDVQKFLNSQGITVDVTGVFDVKTELAVKKFQALYYDDILSKSKDPAPTGHWFQYTRAKANQIVCSQQTGGSTQDTTQSNQKQLRSLKHTQ